MNKSYLFLFASLFVVCSNPASDNDKESIITCLNGISYLVRYNHCPQGTCPEHFTNIITTDRWTTLNLHFNLNDSLKSISVSPGKHDTLCFDTLWAEDTNHTTKIYTFENVTTYDTTLQLAFGWSGSTSIDWKKLDTKTLAFCTVPPVPDSTYSAEIVFIHPILSTGHVRIRLKANR
jgi:hypothetical protein